MQKKKNDVKARTTLLLSLHDEHQLRFSKYKTARELWAAILKTFGGNEATKKTKKNLLKQQYGKFKAEGSENLEQMFNRLQVIVGQLQFMDVEIEQDDLNQKFLTKVQKKSEPNSQNMAFISLAKHNSENEDGNTTCVSTASTNVPTASASVATIIQDTACAYSASQSSDKFWKKTWKKISIKGSDVAGFDKSKDRGRRYNYRQGCKAEEQAPKALMDLSWTGLPECANGIVTDYSRPSPTVESTSGDDKNINPSVSKTVASPITPKPFIKFVKPKDSQSKSKTCKTESPKKPPVKYAKQYRKLNKKPNVRGNQRNWNNLKSHQLGPDFVIKKKACFNCGDFNHLAYDCRKRVKKSFTPKLVVHRP
nr:ribonuclease H-like domain-containing protein [Tanacetum cinerariifolium]